MRRTAFFLLASFAAAGIIRADVETAEGMMPILPEEKEQEHKWFSFSGFADVETAYLCRGFVWDKHPFSSQYADGTLDLGAFGRFSGYAWSMFSWSPASHTWNHLHYRFTEVDYGLRYAFDLELAEDWKLTSGAAKQWVTFPGLGHSDSHSVIDWEAFQSLRNPYLVPYWKMRYIYKPFTEFYWIAGVKRTFPFFVEGLELTFDFFGDLGDARHCRNLFGPRPSDPHSNYHGGIQSINAVMRFDYLLTDYLSVFAFVGYYGLVSDDARHSVKAMHHTDAECDLVYGGIGLSIDF